MNTQDLSSTEQPHPAVAHLSFSKVGPALPSLAESKLNRRLDSLPPLNHVRQHLVPSAIPAIDVSSVRARSFLFGRVLASGPLLGEKELLRYFPNRKVSVFVGTWNMNSKTPSSNLDDFLLPENLVAVPDIYAIGTQEAPSDKQEWEVLLQTTLGPSHVLMDSISLGSLQLCLFLRRDLIWFCSEFENTTLPTRPLSALCTKGAVAVCFYFFGTSFLFINSHLPAFQEQMQARIEDFKKIIQTLNLPKDLPLKKSFQNREDVSEMFDCVFWMGDLNFRVEEERNKVIEMVHSEAAQEDPDFKDILKKDQLLGAISLGQAFTGFSEAPIRFGPTYKFEIGSSVFSEVGLRVPSYTDRILYKSRVKSDILWNHYNMVDTIHSSDHKPVFGTFQVAIRPGNDNIPLAAGLFQRDVYLQAMERRSRALDATKTFNNNQYSAVCSIT